MFYAIDVLDDRDNQSLFNDVEVLEHGTLQVEGICSVIVNYGKYAETVASLAKNIRYNLYQYHDEMVMMSMKDGWCEERFVNDKVGKLLVSLEDDIRELQKIVADEENALVEVITREAEITVADAMALAGLRKCIEISEDMVCALVCIMQVTNKYVDIFYDSEKMKKVTGCSEIKYRGLCK